MSTATSTMTAEPAHARGVDSITQAAHEHTHSAAPSMVGAPASKWDALIKEASCHVTLVLAGWSDASSGPLIPYIQAYFGLSYTIVSMLFVGQMVGFVTAAMSTGYLTAKLGLGRVITLGAIIQMLGYIFIIPAWSFPVMPVCYAIVGFGMALQDASANTYVATLPNVEHKMAFLHASYGLGAVVCPLAATAFASSGIRFSYFYGISIGLALINVAILLYAFRFNYRIEEAVTGAHEDESEGIALQTLGGAGEVDAEKNTPPPSPTATRSGGPSGTETETNSLNAVPAVKRNQLAETLSSKALWLFSIFIVLYVGSEVSMGGWIVTFVIDNRHGGPSAGYIATGFWLGILLGRATLSWLTVRVGEKRVLFGYLIIAIGLEFGIMFSKSLVGNGVIVGLVGYVMGPSYPIVMSVAVKVIPRRLHASSIGFIAAFGQLGAAIFPFATGALSQKYSPAALQPVMIVLLGTQALIWVFAPTPRKKIE